MPPAISSAQQPRAEITESSGKGREPPSRSLPSHGFDVTQSWASLRGDALAGSLAVEFFEKFGLLHARRMAKQFEQGVFHFFDGVSAST